MQCGRLKPSHEQLTLIPKNCTDLVRDRVAGKVPSPSTTVGGSSLSVDNTSCAQEEAQGLLSLGFGNLSL